MKTVWSWRAHECEASKREGNASRSPEAGRDYYFVRVTQTDGNILWSTSAKDIFTEGFRLGDDNVEATDFNNEIYLINIDNGESTIVPNNQIQDICA